MDGKVGATELSRGIVNALSNWGVVARGERVTREPFVGRSRLVGFYVLSV